MFFMFLESVALVILNGGLISHNLLWRKLQLVLWPYKEQLFKNSYFMAIIYVFLTYVNLILWLCS